PGLAGGVIQLLTAPLALLVDALALATSAVLVLSIRSPEPAPHPDSRHGRGWGAIFAGLRPLWADPIVRSIAVSTTIYLFFSNLMIPVFVLYATRELGVTPGTLGLIFGFGGVGSVCGAVVALPTARRWGIGPAMIGADLAGALFLLLVPLARAAPLAAVPLLMAAQFGSQLMGTVFYVVQTSVRQARTPDRVAGRLNASYSFVTRSLIPAGALLGGVLGQIVGLQATLAIGALGLLLPVVWLCLSPVRGLRTIDAPEQR
ncbi:MAG TPA: MFS transporter, partial [Candidatus Limnocylindria bacterium]|nr:MFS transporter [Candidatus Limnocylindria bacterium]